MKLYTGSTHIDAKAVCMNIVHGIIIQSKSRNKYYSIITLVHVRDADLFRTFCDIFIFFLKAAEQTILNAPQY